MSSKPAGGGLRVREERIGGIFPLSSFSQPMTRRNVGGSTFVLGSRRQIRLFQ